MNYYYRILFLPTQITTICSKWRMFRRVFALMAAIISGVFTKYLHFIFSYNDVDYFWCGLYDCAYF
jgi:hypothetical protein